MYYGTNRTQLALNSQITNLQTQITNIVNNPNIYVRSGTTSQTYNWTLSNSVSEDVKSIRQFQINNIPINFALLSIRITSGTATMRPSSTRTGNVYVDIGLGSSDDSLHFGSAILSMSSSSSQDSFSTNNPIQCLMTSDSKIFAVVTNSTYTESRVSFLNSKIPIAAICSCNTTSIPSGTSFSASLNFSYKGIYFT